MLDIRRPRVLAAVDATGSFGCFPTVLAWALSAVVENLCSTAKQTA